MIESLHIKNFLAFPELEVPELKLINLVAGKNTAGKTSLLQAIDILYSEDKLGTVNSIHNTRKVDYGGIIHQQNKDFTFTSQINEFMIGLKSQTSYEVKRKDVKGTVPYIPAPFGSKKALSIDPNFSYGRIAAMWNDIALTEKEVEVIDIVNNALSIKIQRVAVIGEIIKVLLADDNTPVRIETLGDGVKRVMSIALNLVAAKDGLLLIDEIETHLHHSVIRKMWKIIFEYSTNWNIQVVATTHSQDAIREFWYEAAEQAVYQENSQVLRLQKSRDGKHEIIQFPFGLLESAMEMEMEIR